MDLGKPEEEIQVNPKEEPIPGKLPALPVPELVPA